MVDLVTDRRPTLDSNNSQPVAHRPSPKVDESSSPSCEQRLPHLNDEIAGTLVQNFKLLADETRLRILYYLMHRKELNVRSLCELLQQSQPAVSHHLALLRNAELIDSRRDGKHNFYHLIPDKFQDLIDTLVTASPGQSAEVHFSDFVKIPASAE